MLRKLSRRLTYANVMSTIAVFGVLAGGTAYAANTVFSTDIVDGEVKSVDIGDAEIKSADVKDQSLTTFDVSTFLGADVVDDTLTGSDINESTLGAVPNANGLGGIPASYLRPGATSGFQRTDLCITTVNAWTECGATTVTVPSGQYYHATVTASITYNPGNFDAGILYCVADSGPACLSGTPEIGSAPPNRFSNFTQSYSVYLGAGSHRLNFAIKVPTLPIAYTDAHATVSVSWHNYYSELISGGTSAARVAKAAKAGREPANVFVPKPLR
jgi:hypothetical protein